MFREFLEMKEWKQVGIIYHFTKLANLEMMLKYNFLMVSRNNHFSTTRKYNLPTHNKGDVTLSRGYNVRIQIDGNRLSEKYKIKPLRGATHPTNDIFQNNVSRVPYWYEENEEVILNIEDGLELKNFILGVDILKSEVSKDEILKINKLFQKTRPITSNKFNFVEKWMPIK